jgi:hypothetical protein
MGLFSWECKRCSHPLLWDRATDDDGTNTWMSHAVALFPNGSVLVGDYDGYGRIGGAEIGELGDEAETYHKACWEVAGKPTTFTEASRSAQDQGWFFEDGEHSMADPRLAQSP